MIYGQERLKGVLLCRSESDLTPYTVASSYRLIDQMRSNALSWSPTFPTSMLLASEDHNLYTFDIRHLSTPTQIYKAHVAAVMSCDWSPTGLEFVSGGWDRTVRIWQTDRGTQPEVYHTKRMQRVSSTVFSGDARFVLTGSDDGNVRIWKAKASDKLGVVTARERAAMEYRDGLRERWKMDAEVGRVSRCVVTYPRSILLSPNNVQGTAYPKASTSRSSTQADHAGCKKSQGGAQKKTHQGWGEQAKSRTKKGCACRTDMMFAYYHYGWFAGCCYPISVPPESTGIHQLHMGVPRSYMYVKINYRSTIVDRILLRTLGMSAVFATRKPLPGSVFGILLCLDQCARLW